MCDDPVLRRKTCFLTLNCRQQVGTLGAEDPSIMPETFGARLRQRRERAGIALAIIAEQTKINVALLEGLERDDVSRWPSGIFSRAFIRGYAHAIGLEPEAIVREFLELYPDPADT